MTLCSWAADEASSPNRSGDLLYAGSLWLHMMPRRVLTPASSIACIATIWSADFGSRTQKLCQLLRAHSDSCMQLQARHSREQAYRYRAASARRSCTMLRQPLELLPPNRRLDVRHPVVVADCRVRLEDHLCRAVTHGVGHAHRMLAQQPELSVPFGVARREHAAIARADHLSRMKRETRHVTVRATDLLPFAFPVDLAADGAGRVLDQRQPMLARDRHDAPQVAGHADLVDAPGWPSCAA